MGLIEIVLTGLCLNVSCVTENAELFQVRKNRENFHRTVEELKSQHLRITTISNGILSGYKTDGNGSVIGTGVAFDVINILQNKYGFNYTVVPPGDDTFDENNNNGTVKSMLITGQADVAAAFIPITYESSVIYSRSFDTADWALLMNRPKESATGSGLLAPFTAVVWTYIVISVLAMGPILYIIMYLRHRFCKDDDSKVFSMQACMWFVYGALLKQGSTLSPITDSSRVLFSTWWIFIIILTAFYTANLTAFLTLSQFTLPITKPEDVKAKHYKWVTNRGNGIIKHVEMNMNLSDEIGAPTVDLSSNDSEILDKYILGNTNMMYIRERIVLEYTMYKHYRRMSHKVEESERCTYVITNFPVATLPRAFVFAPGFKYQEIFDTTIQDLVESGIVTFKQRQNLPEITICPLNLGNSERRLRNSDLLMTYMIVGGGLVLSSVIFLIEILMKLCNRNTQATSNNRTALWVEKVNNNNNNNNIETIEFGKQKYVTPPPPYSTLIKQVAFGDHAMMKKMINGREYWVVNNQFGGTNLIPHRTPSALLFQFTH